MTENVHNFEIVIDISGVAEFYVNTYDVSLSRSFFFFKHSRNEMY